MCARTMCFSCAASFNSYSVIADFSQFAFSASHFFLCVLFSFFVIFQLCPIYSCNFATYDAHSFFLQTKTNFHSMLVGAPPLEAPGSQSPFPQLQCPWLRWAVAILLKQTLQTSYFPLITCYNFNIVHQSRCSCIIYTNLFLKSKYIFFNLHLLSLDFPLTFHDVTGTSSCTEAKWVWVRTVIRSALNTNQKLLCALVLCKCLATLTVCQRLGVFAVTVAALISCCFNWNTYSRTQHTWFKDLCQSWLTVKIFFQIITQCKNCCLYVLNGPRLISKACSGYVLYMTEHQCLSESCSHPLRTKTRMQFI